MPTYLTVCETGAFVVSPSEITTVLIVPNGIGNVIASNMPSAVVNPQAVFLCDDECAAFALVDEWKSRSRSSKFDPTNISWPKATYLGRAPHNLAIATPAQTLALTQ